MATMATIPAPSKAPLEPPPGVLLIQDFINTLHTDGPLREDEFGSPRDLARWLSDHKLLQDQLELSEADVVHVAAVREALRDLLSANEGKKPNKSAVDTLARAARSAQLVVCFEPDGQARLRPAARGVDAALGELLAHAARSMLDGSWSRLKACHNDGCRWAFYDRSKNHSTSWCSMRTCGNRAKARRFRERHS
jgi:predicted RNA-binding Zn ribbon-like protein